MTKTKRSLSCCGAGGLIGLIAHELLGSSIGAVSQIGAALIIPGIPGVFIYALLFGSVTPHEEAFYTVVEASAALFYAILFYFAPSVVRGLRRRLSSFQSRAR